MVRLADPISVPLHALRDLHGGYGAGLGHHEEHEDHEGDAAGEENHGDCEDDAVNVGCAAPSRLRRAGGGGGWGWWMVGGRRRGLRWGYYH